MKNIKWLLALGFVLAMIASACDACVDTDVNVEPSTTKKTGELNITISDLTKIVQGNDKEYLSVTYSGVLKSASGDGTGETTFLKTRNYEATRSNVIPNPGLSRLGLKFGTWEVTVQTGSWTARCQATVSKNKGGNFNFTYPRTSGNCN